MLVNIFGKRGAGKTTMIRASLPQCQGPVVVLDILGNFTQKRNEKGEKIPPFFRETESISTGVEYLNEYLKNPDEKNKIIVLRTADPDLSIDFMSAALWEAKRGTLVIDEADGFDIHSSPCFDWLIRYGRNRNIDLLTGCRRPAEISRNITAGANRIYAFRTQEPRDIEYFRATVFGDRAFELMEVEPYSGLYVDYDLLEIGRFSMKADGSVFILTRESIR